MINIPQIADIGVAVWIYYNKPLLSTKEIKILFGEKIGSNTITRLKDVAKEKMAEDNVCFWNSRMVDTETAFKAWGLDIASMERRYAKLQKYGFVKDISLTNTHDAQ